MSLCGRGDLWRMRSARPYRSAAHRHTTLKSALFVKFAINAPFNNNKKIVIKMLGLKTVLIFKTHFESRSAFFSSLN